MLRTLKLSTLALLFGCASNNTPASAPAPAEAAEMEPLHSVMQQHFVHLDDLQKAVIAGDLTLAKQSARWVMDHHVEVRNEGWRPHLAKLEKAAAHVTQAPDLMQASVGAARVAGACGSCHEAHGIQMHFGAVPAAEGEDTRAHMKRHQWAADRLWDAVVGNSDPVWDEATTALADAPLHLADGREGPTDLALEMINEAAEVVHRVGEQGAQTKGRDARVEALGEFLSTCAACHSQLGIDPEAQ